MNNNKLSQVFSLAEAKLNLNKLDLNYNSSVSDITKVLVNMLENLENLFKDMKNTYIFSTFSFSDLEKQPGFKGTLNFCTKYYRGTVNYEEVLKNIADKNIEVKSVFIIEVEPFSENKMYTMSCGDIELNLQTMSLDDFFKKIESHSNFISWVESDKDKDIIGFNPIIVFKNISWANVLYSARVYKYILHGGSSTRRHKLSIIEYKLSSFLYVSGLLISKSQYYTDYIENKESVNRNIGFQVNYLSMDELNKDNSYSYYYYWLNATMRMGLDIKSIFEDLNILLSKIESNESHKVYLENQSSDLSSRIQILSNKQSDPDNVYSEKRKRSISGSRRLLSSENLELKSKISEVDVINNKIILEYEKKLADINKKLSTWYTKLRHIKDTELNLRKMVYLDTEDSTFNYNDTFKASSSVSRDSWTRGVRKYSTLSKTKEFKKKSIFLDHTHSELYLEVDRIFKTEPLNRDTQLKIEYILYHQGLFILNTNLNKQGDLNLDKLNPSILNILKSEIDNLFQLLANLKNNVGSIYDEEENDKFGLNIARETLESKVFNNLEDKLVISLLLGRLLKIISNNGILNNNTIFTNVAIDLADSLAFELRKKEYVRRYTEDTGVLLQDVISEEYSQESLFRLGSKLLNLLIDVKLIHIEIQQLEKKEKINVLRTREDIAAKLNVFKLIDLPYYIPMIVKPNKYSASKMGGYLLNGKEFMLPLIIHNWELKHPSSIEDDNLIYDVINKLNEVSFKINVPVLEYILEYGLDKKLILDSENKHRLELKLKLNRTEKKELESFLSKKQLETNILTLAQLFRNVPEFYIPLRIDNRGRIYCIASYLNYQSIELAKALLLFSKGTKVYKTDRQSIYFLKIYGANCFGNKLDKCSFKERIEWVEKNEENILNFRNGILIDQADNKLLFIAWCFEYVHYKNSLNNEASYWITHLPIQFDGTCNGYQHLALLMGDNDLLSDLNLGQFDENFPPKDFYGLVSLNLHKYFKTKVEELSSNPQHKEISKLKAYENLSSMVIPRSLVKAPIMVKPYNATNYQMAKYIEKEFDLIPLNKTDNKSRIDDIVDDLSINPYSVPYKYTYKYNPHMVFTREEFMLLARSIDIIIYKEYPKLLGLSDYLKNIADICTNINISIPWLLPTGLKVQQYYIDSEAIRLRPFKYKKNTFTLKIANKDKINKPKQIRALMPNLIHSLDSASLTMLVNIFDSSSTNREYLNFYSIHDCFAVNCNEVAILFEALKTVYLSIYSDDAYLLKFDQGVLNSIITHLGENAYDPETRIIQVADRKLQYPNVNDIFTQSIDSRLLKSSNSGLN